MDVNERLKSALIGGYEKESVLQFIESLLETHQTDSDKLKNDLTQQCAINTNRTEQNQRMLTQYHELADSMQGLARNMETLLSENKYLSAQVARYKERESDLVALRQEIEEAANDLIQDAQADAWLMEEKSRHALRETEAHVAQLLSETEAAQAEITYHAVARRAAAIASLEKELRGFALLAKKIGLLGDKAEAALSHCVNDAAQDMTAEATLCGNVQAEDA